MKKYKSIADEVLRRKAQDEADEEARVEALADKMVESRLAEIKAKKSPDPPLEVHTLEPVLPLKVEKPVIQEKPVERKKLESKGGRKEDRRKLNLMPPLSLFERRGQK